MAKSAFTLRKTKLRLCNDVALQNSSRLHVVVVIVYASIEHLRVGVRRCRVKGISPRVSFQKVRRRKSCVVHKRCNCAEKTLAQLRLPGCREENKSYSCLCAEGMAFLGFFVPLFCLWTSFSLATSLVQGPMPILAVQLDAPKRQLPQAARLHPFFPALTTGGICRFEQLLPSWSGRAKRKRRQARRVFLEGLPLLPSRLRWLTCSSRMTGL